MGALRGACDAHDRPVAAMMAMPGARGCGQRRRRLRQLVLAMVGVAGAWASSALALALGSSQRSVQRALESLVRAGKVQSYGHGRARRWMMPPVPGFTTSLLLPLSLPSG